MTQEEAFEKLELPLGSDLQSIRKRFAEMHNDYRMQIDNAFNPTSKRNFEQKLEELKEAYALLNESEGIDDNSSLPRVGVNYEDTTILNNPQDDIDYSLALFGLRKDQDKTEIVQIIQNYLADLERQRNQVNLPEAKEVYSKALDKAETAKVAIEDWLNSLSKEEEYVENLHLEGEQSVEANDSTKYVKPRKEKFSWQLLVVLVVLIGAIGIWWFVKDINSGQAEASTVQNVEWKPTHYLSTELKETLVLRNRELAKEEFSKLSTDAALNAKTYASEVKAGDSLFVIEERNDFFIVQPAKAELNKQYFLAKNADTQKYLIPIGQNRVWAVDTTKLATSQTEIPTATDKPNSNWRKQYDDIGDFSEGYASVWLKNKVGFVDRSGNVVVPIIYEDANWFSEGLVAVQLNRKWGFVDNNGTVVIPLKYEYDSFYAYNEGLAYVKLDNKLGYINKRGEQVVPFKYDSAMDFNNGMGRIISNKKYGYVDKNGKEVIAPKYDVGQDFENGLARVGINRKYGFIDKSGAVVVPIKYDQVQEFVEGLAPVQINKLWGYIDKQGNEVIAPQFDTAGDFRKNGQAGAKLNGKSIIINRKGEYVRDCTEC